MRWSVGLAGLVAAMALPASSRADDVSVRASGDVARVEVSGARVKRDRVVIPAGSVHRWRPSQAPRSTRLLSAGPQMYEYSVRAIRASARGRAIVVGTSAGERASVRSNRLHLRLRSEAGERNAVGTAVFADGSTEALMFKNGGRGVLAQTRSGSLSKAVALRFTVHRHDRDGVVVARRLGAPLAGASFHIERGTRNESGRCVWSGGLAVGPDFRGVASQQEIVRDDSTCEALVEQGTDLSPAAQALAYAARDAGSGSRTVTNYSRWEDPLTIPLAGIRTRLSWTYSPSTILSVAPPADAPTFFRPTGWRTWTNHTLRAETGADEAWATSAAQFAGAQKFYLCHHQQVIATFRDNRVTAYPGGRYAVSGDTELSGAKCRSLLHFARTAIVGGT